MALSTEAAASENARQLFGAMNTDHQRRGLQCRRPATPPTKPRGELAVPVETFNQRRFAKRQILG
jgi:hypothetical protein